MSSESWLNIPNSITLFRLGLVPVFLVLELTHQPGWALACFATASVSDGLDGLLARLLNQRTKLGGVLDPIADKVLINAALISLVIDSWLPLWLLLITAGRDLLMVVGAIVVKRKNLEIPTEPSRLGKYATFFMVCVILLSLVRTISGAPAFLHAYVAVLGFVAGLCVVTSTIQYFARYGYLWVAPARRVPANVSATRPARDEARV
jgi:cardiolipin synthase